MSQHRSNLPLIIAIVLFVAAGVSGYMAVDRFAEASAARSRADRAADKIVDPGPAGDAASRDRAVQSARQASDRAVRAMIEAEGFERHGYIMSGVGGLLLLASIAALLRWRRS